MWPALLAVGAGALGAIGTLKQGNAQAAAMRTNAAINRQNADLRMQAAAIEEGRFRTQVGDKFKAKQKVAFAKSGAMFTGSVAEVIGETARQVELDALNIRYKGAMDAYNFMIGSAQQEAAAVNTLRAARLSAATKMLAAGAQAASFGGGTAGATGQTSALTELNGPTLSGYPLYGVTD